MCGVLRLSALWGGIAVLGAAILLREAPVVTGVVAGVLLAAIGLAATLRTARRPSLKGILTAGGLLLGSCVLAVGILEAGARIAFAPEPQAHADYLMPHPLYVHTLRPDTHTILDRRHVQWRDFDIVRIDISPQGFRDRVLPPKEPGEMRILVLGDSFTFGYGVEADQTISYYLEQALRSAGPGGRISVVNAGIEGYGPWQSRGLLEERGFPLDPDLVVYQTFATNDLYDTLVRVGKFFRAYHLPSLERVHAFRCQALWHVGLQRWLRTHSSAYQQAVRMTQRENLLVDLLDHVRFIRRLPPLDLPPREDRNYKLEVCLRSWYPELEEAWDLYREDVCALRADCEARGVEFVACCMPPLHLFFDPYWIEFVGANDPAIYERGKGVRVVEEFFREQEIPYVPLVDTLAAYPNPLQVYFRFNKHLRPEGCRAVGKAIASYLLDAGLVSGDGADGKKEKVK